MLCGAQGESPKGDTQIDISNTSTISTGTTASFMSKAFEDALRHIREAHLSEVDSISRTYEQQVSLLEGKIMVAQQQIDGLRSSLEAGSRQSRKSLWSLPDKAPLRSPRSPRHDGCRHKLVAVFPSVPAMATEPVDSNCMSSSWKEEAAFREGVVLSEGACMDDVLIRFSDMDGSTNGCSSPCCKVPNGKTKGSTVTDIDSSRTVSFNIKDSDLSHSLESDSPDFYESMRVMNTGTSFAHTVCEFSAEEQQHTVKLWEKFVVVMLQQASRDFFQLRPAWVQVESFVQKQIRTGEHVDVTRVMSRPRSTQKLKSTATSLSGSSDEAEQVKWSEMTCSQIIMLDPRSPFKVFWAICGMMLMLYDVVMLPAQGAFDIPDHDAFTAVNFITQTFWTIDILLSFITGVYINSELEMRFLVVMKEYLRTWFPVDVIVTMPLWVLFFTGFDQGDAKATQGLKAAKYIRMLRFLRLARLAKANNFLSETLEFINSSAMLLCIGIFKLVLGLMLVNHVNACLWFAVGKTKSGGESGWATEVSKSEEQSSIWYQYAAASHWAVTQFQGTSEINPGGTLVERAYAVGTVVLALIILSSFVSSLTNMMMQLQSLHAKRTHQQRVVRAYLSNHQISNQLSIRVKKYVAWKQRLEEKQENDTEVLHVLPARLITDLLEEVRGPLLYSHPFFKICRTAFPRLIRRLCSESLQPTSPAPGEYIFNTGDMCSHMYFIKEGVATYSIVRAAARKPRVVNNLLVYAEYASVLHHGDRADTESHARIEQTLKGGQYLCEAMLWTHWEHLGDLTAGRSISLFVVLQSIFTEVLRSHPPAHASAILYARSFVAGLNRFGKVYYDFISLEELMEMMKDGD